jgi:Fe-Mn family superoxide dismutase
MRFHHDFHHAAYVKACNDLVPRWRELAATPAERILADLDNVPATVRDPVATIWAATGTTRSSGS